MLACVPPLQGGLRRRLWAGLWAGLVSIAYPFAMASLHMMFARRSVYPRRSVGTMVGLRCVRYNASAHVLLASDPLVLLLPLPMLDAAVVLRVMAGCCWCNRPLLLQLG